MRKGNSSAQELGWIKKLGLRETRGKKKRKEIEREKKK